MDKSLRLKQATRGVVTLGVLGALFFNIPSNLYAGNVSERDLPGVNDAGVGHDPVLNQTATQTPSAESLHGEAVVANSVSPANRAKDDFSTGTKSIGSGFKNGTKATGRGFKKAGTTMGKGFKTAGNTMGKGFKKAGHGIKWFFTGQWLSKKDKAQVEQRDLTAEKPMGVEPYQYETPRKPKGGDKPSYQEDDLELDFDGEGKGDDWASQDRRGSQQPS